MCIARPLRPQNCHHRLCQQHHGTARGHGQGARPQQRPPQDTSSFVLTLTAFPPDFWSNGTIVIRLDSRSYVQ